MSTVRCIPKVPILAHGRRFEADVECDLPYDAWQIHSAAGNVEVRAVRDARDRAAAELAEFEAKARAEMAALEREARAKVEADLAALRAKPPTRAS